MDAHSVVTLAGLDGALDRSLSPESTWLIEDREDSTNRLTIEATLADASDVTVDRELVFRRRRFKVTSVNRVRSTRSATIEADEVQVELADNIVPIFKLEGRSLAPALTAALSGSRWSAGTVADDSGGQYFADFERQPSNKLVAFLAAQSGLRPQFDSLNRRVSLIEADEGSPDRVLAYAVGMKEIEKRSDAPTATVIHPTGRDGMTIGAVNGGVDYVEDFTWYTSQGLSLSEARARFTRELWWQDQRYIYPVNLRNDAQRKLALLAHPQISYTLTPDTQAIDGLELGSLVWVHDDELGIKLSTRVVRRQESSDGRDNALELAYLPPSLGATMDEAGGDSTLSPTGNEVLFQVKNQTDVTVGTVPTPALQSQINVFADTGFQVGLTVRLSVTAAGLIGGYFLLNGERLDPEIMQTATPGWYTFGLPFLVSPVAAGPVTLDFYLAVEGGAGVVPALGAEMYVSTRGAHGGLRHTRPDRRVIDHMPSDWMALSPPADAVTVRVQTPVHLGVADEIDAALDLDVEDSLTFYRLGLPFTVSGATLTMWGGDPFEELTVAVEGVVAGPIQADANGDFEVDLADHFGLEPGIHDCLIVETGQRFMVQVGSGFSIDSEDEE